MYLHLVAKYLERTQQGVYLHSYTQLDSKRGAWSPAWLQHVIEKGLTKNVQANYGTLFPTHHMVDKNSNEKIEIKPRSKDYQTKTLPQNKANIMVVALMFDPHDLDLNSWTWFLTCSSASSIERKINVYVTKA